MSAVLEFTQEPPSEFWLISRDEPVRKKVWLTPEEEEKIINSTRYELVGGELYERPMANPGHGRIQAKFAARLINFVEEHNLGVIYTETHFELKKKLIRIPDIAFVSFERFPKSGEPKGSKWLIPPDLAIEVISPTDDYENVLKKMSEYFAVKVKQVWLLSPEQRILTVYRSRKDVTILTEEDELVCNEVLPGFRLKLSDLFRKPMQK